MSSLLIRNPDIDNITISPIEIPGWDAGYNMGDLLNAPLLRDNLVLSERQLANVQRGQKAVLNHMPNSVVSRYLNRVGKEDWSQAPRGDVLRKVLREQRLISDQLTETERLVRSEKTLVVHLRIGDHGTRYASAAKKFLVNVAYRFELAILLFGLHARHNLYDEQGQ